MDIKSYRRQIEREIVRRQPSEGEDAPSEGSVALATLGGGAASESDAIEEALSRLADEGAEAGQRKLALQSLKQASFSSPNSADWRPQFLEALRAASQTDDKALRFASLEVLSAMKDRPTQELLLEGLRDPDVALVTPEQALRLLSYDVHSGVQEVAAEIVSDPPSEESRREALQLLASDAGFAPRFAELLGDAGESGQVRRLAATALCSLEPETFEELAAELAGEGGFESASAPDQGLLLHVQSLRNRRRP